MSENPPSERASEPLTQARSSIREKLPIWAQQLPQLKFPEEPNEKFRLINTDEFKSLGKKLNLDAKALENLEEDMAFLETELLTLFRERDFEASLHQNRYRLYQIGFMLLAAIAAIAGSLQALTFTDSPSTMPLCAFTETVIALLTTYLATITGREPPLPLWLASRRRAEYLRREYFRYLMNLKPYHEKEGYEKKMLLSARAADINRGIFPDSSGN